MSYVFTVKIDEHDSRHARRPIGMWRFHNISRTCLLTIRHMLPMRNAAATIRLFGSGPWLSIGWILCRNMR